MNLDPRAYLQRIAPVAAPVLAVYSLGSLVWAAIVWDLSAALAALACLLVAAALHSVPRTPKGGPDPRPDGPSRATGAA